MQTRINHWRLTARSGFWKGLEWWGKHQRRWWMALVVFLFVWFAYDFGRVVTRSELITMGGPTRGTMDMPKLLEHTSQLRGGRIIITGENTARLIDRVGQTWEISNFGNSLSRDALNQLRDNLVLLEGEASVNIRPIKTTPRDLVVSTVINNIVKIAIVGFYVLIVFLLLRFMLSSGNRFNKITGDLRPKVKIADVAGHEGPKKEVTEVVEYLRDPSRFTRAGARPPRGVLLYGPPGTGKTLLAKAIAGEAEASFLEQTASSFVQIYAGAGAKSVRALFAQARKQRPCVIFIDEIDAVGGARSSMGSHDERVQCLNALLSEMDGFQDNDGIAVIAATNRLEVLDDALVRAGRFDRKVHVPLPGRPDRLEILKHHASKLPDLTARLEHWAAQTRGFSGADLASLVNEAAVEAARAGHSTVGDEQFAAARDRVMMGARDHGRIMTDRDRKFVAYHEAGHALVKLINGGRVEKISILPRSGSLGVTVSIDEDETLLLTREEIDQQLQVLMAGRAAEEVFFDTVTGGAADDMARASHLAREAIERYGLSGAGPYQPKHEQMRHESEKQAAKWVLDSYEHARSVVREHRDRIDILAKLLLEQDEMSEDQVRSILLPPA